MADDDDGRWPLRSPAAALPPPKKSASSRAEAVESFIYVTSRGVRKLMGN